MPWFQNVNANTKTIKMEGLLQC